jgi:hypothetical protein
MAFGRGVGPRDAGPFLTAWAQADPRGDLFGRGEGGGSRAEFCKDLLRCVDAATREFAPTFHRLPVLFETISQRWRDFFPVPVQQFYVLQGLL